MTQRSPELACEARTKFPHLRLASLLSTIGFQSPSVPPSRWRTQETRLGGVWGGTGDTAEGRNALPSLVEHPPGPVRPGRPPVPTSSLLVHHRCVLSQAPHEGPLFVAVVVGQGTAPRSVSCLCVSGTFPGLSFGKSSRTSALPVRTPPRPGHCPPCQG